jgi:cytoplasmic iron level regulating protein YaaA (DUF328/UPF0246 family)
MDKAEILFHWQVQLQNLKDLQVFWGDDLSKKIKELEDKIEELKTK